MVKPPGSLDIADEITALKRRINEQSRQGAQRDRLKVNFYWTYEGSAPSGEFRDSNNWDTPQVDTANMWVYKEPGTLRSYIKIPYAGRWRIKCDTAWGRFNDGLDHSIGTSIRLNDDVGTAFNSATQLCYNAMLRPNTPGIVRCVADTEHVFSTGDHVSFVFYSGFAGGRLCGMYLGTGAPDQPLAPTYIMAEYIGPK